MKEFDKMFEKIVKDIVKKQDNAKAMEFTKSVGTMLRENGVVPFMTEFIEKPYEYALDRLDFTEHDKVFKDKIEKLKDRINKMSASKSDCIGKAVEWKHKCEKLEKRIEELENQKTTDLPFDPMEVANYLINATYKRKTSSIEQAFYKTPDKVDEDKYSIDVLEQIAEHLLIYCKHNKGCGE